MLQFTFMPNSQISAHSCCMKPKFGSTSSSHGTTIPISGDCRIWLYTPFVSLPPTLCRLLARQIISRERFAAVLDFTFSDKLSLGKLPMGSVRDRYSIITQLRIKQYLIWIPRLFASARCGERDMYLTAKKAPIGKSVASK